MLGSGEKRILLQQTKHVKTLTSLVCFCLRRSVAAEPTSQRQSAPRLRCNTRVFLGVCVAPLQLLTSPLLINAVAFSSPSYRLHRKNRPRLVYGEKSSEIT